jgi:orotate phosphoribosyltransferase
MDDLKALISDLKTRALIQGEEFTLASGIKSSVYVDCKQVTLWGPSLARISRLFLKELRSISPKPAVAAGVSIGGDPLVAGVLMEAERSQWPLEGLLIRKEAKDHGRSQGRRWEGRQPSSADTIWLLEDVISTGKSSLSAAQYLFEAGFKLGGILSIVDREMGGNEKLTKELKIPVRSLLRLSQLTDT